MGSAKDEFPPIPVESWRCGECDERWIETPDGLAKCPRCYPVERSA